MTTGGTESILMAVKAYRERAKDLSGVSAPNMVLSISAHPAFEKAGHYFGVEMRCVRPVTETSCRVQPPPRALPLAAPASLAAAVLCLWRARRRKHAVRLACRGWVFL
jgi:hypothetical protein